MKTNLRRQTAGFTLIESLIALAVLAITAVSFLRATEFNVARVAELEMRAAAGLVAQNRLTEVNLRMQMPQGNVSMLGREFMITVAATPTADPGLTQVVISADPVSGGTGALLTGFVVDVAEGGS